MAFELIHLVFYASYSEVVLANLQCHLYISRRDCHPEYQKGLYIYPSDHQFKCKDVRILPSFYFWISMLKSYFLELFFLFWRDALNV
jgi:hypothetical protein